jgi:hypothetical protein
VNPKPGDTVVLTEIPLGLLDGLPIVTAPTSMRFVGSGAFVARAPRRPLDCSRAKAGQYVHATAKLDAANTSRAGTPKSP